MATPDAARRKIVSDDEHTNVNETPTHRVPCETVFAVHMRRNGRVCARIFRFCGVDMVEEMEVPPLVSEEEWILVRAVRASRVAEARHRHPCDKVQVSTEID